MEEEKYKYRDKAVGSHNDNAGLFSDRYEKLDKDPYYDAFIYGRKKIFELILPLIKKNIKVGSGVLDVGGGTGYFAEQLRQAGYKVKAIEPARGMREQAAKRYPKLEIMDGQATSLPFDDNSFDLVTAIEVFRYLHKDDIGKGYKECLRVLKPGGYLIITLVNRYAPDGFIFYYYFKLALEKLFNRQIVNYCYFTTPKAEIKTFKKMGASEVNVYGRLLAQLRILFAINRNLGSFAARKMERLHDRISEKQWFVKFAGHLIVVVKK